MYTNVAQIELVMHTESDVLQGTGILGCGINSDALYLGVLIRIVRRGLPPNSSALYKQVLNLNQMAS